MSKQTRKQKNRGAKPQQPKKTPKGTRRKRPTLKETEAYIKKHNLKVIDPLSDFGFKRLLASERNKDILIHLLNVFIAEDVGVVTEVTYLPTELLGIGKDDKFVRFDLYCTNQNGDRFIVEMQNGRQGNYADRLRVYTSLATVNNLDKEYKYYKRIPHVYSINLMGYDMQEFKGRERFFWKVYLKDDDNEIYSKNIVYYFIELSKFAAQLETLDMGDERNLLLYMFTNVVYLPEQSIDSLTPMQMRFYEECQITNFTDMEKQDYVKSLMEYDDVREMVECERDDAEQTGYERGMQQGMEQGLKQGIEQGLQQGLQQGIEQGMQQGLQQGIQQERRELIDRMLKNGLAPAQVADLTGVSLDEIQEIGELSTPSPLS